MTEKLKRSHGRVNYAALSSLTVVCSAGERKAATTYTPEGLLSYHVSNY